MARTTTRVGLALAIASLAASLVPVGPAHADAPACTPPAPVVVGSRRGLTVRVRPCAAAVGVSGYRLTAYVTGLDIFQPSGSPPPPQVFDVHPGSELVRISAPDGPGGHWVMPTYRFRARAVGAGGALGPLGPSSAGGPHPYTTSSAAANRTWTELFGTNPGSDWRTSAVETINDESLFHLIDLLLADAHFEVQHEVTKLYVVAFVRFPDTAGFRQWTDQRRAGRSVAEVGRAMAASPEFVRRYGALTNRAFVEQMYRNAFDEAGDAAGIEYWTRRLDLARISRGTLVAHFSQTSRLAQRNTIRLGLVGVDWTYALWRQIPSTTALANAIFVAEGETAAMKYLAYSSQRYVERVGTTGPPVISDRTTLPDGAVGTAYDRGLAAEPDTGVSPRPFSVRGLPPGLSFAKNRITGTPTTAGTYAVVVTLTDAKGLTDQRTYGVTIDPA